MKKRKLVRKLRMALIQKRELKDILFWKNSTIDSMKKSIESLSEQRDKLRAEIMDGPRED